MCSKHGVSFPVEMMNSCFVNFLHMLSYNFVLYLVLGLLAISSNLRTWNLWAAKAWSKSKLLRAMIWLNSVAMIFSYVMLDIRSVLFWKHQKYNKVHRWFEIPIQSHMLISLQTIHICNLLSHSALSNCCDPYWDSFHTSMIKIMYTFTPYAMVLH